MTGIRNTISVEDSEVNAALARVEAVGGDTSALMSAAPVEVSVHNYSNATVETREERDERGGRKIRFVMSETVSDAINTPGGATQRTLRENYNLRKQRVRR